MAPNVRPLRPSYDKENSTEHEGIVDKLNSRQLLCFYLGQLNDAARECMEPTPWRDFLLRVKHAGFVSQTLVASKKRLRISMGQTHEWGQMELGNQFEKDASIDRIAFRIPASQGRI
jgi:hypothetical protein